MLKCMFKTSVGLLLALGALTSVHGDGLKVRRPTLTQAQKEKAGAKLEAHKASLKASAGKTKRLTAQQSSPLPDPAFQGWWKMQTRGDIFGFGFGALTDDIDSYLYIDTSQFDPVLNPYITVDTICGTPKYPRECTPLDVGSGISGNIYYVPDSSSLVNISDLNGPAFDPTIGQSFWTLELQADKQTIVASSESQPQWEGYGATSALLTKIPEPPPIRPYNDIGTSFPSARDPVAMAKYVYNALELNHNQPQNVHLKDKDYRCYKKRKSLFKKLLGEGLCYETKIHKMRVTRPGLHDNQAFNTAGSGSYFTTTDALTDIFTDGYAHTTPGATVEICGFEGKWAKLNGTYVNGVALTEEGGNTNPSHKHIDASSSENPKKGTFRNVYNHFMLDFDSSCCEDFPCDELGWATEVEGDPVVKVTHRICSNTEYPAFYAAMREMFFSFYRISQHNAQSAYFKPGSVFLIDTWDELKDAAATNNFWGSRLYPGDHLIRTRTNQKVPSGFYNNPVMAERGVTTYNDPFGLNQMPGGKYDYNIVLTNYIVAPKNLYWAIAGTPTGPTQFDPTDVGYLPAIPGPQAAEFVGALGDIQVVNGKPQPQNPDPNYYSIYSSISLPNNDVRNSNGYYVGLIDPCLTKGKRVGYLRWIDEDGIDPLFLMGGATFPPNVPVTVKYGREAYCQVISNYTRYLQTDLDCDAVILDVRTNNGGYILTEFNLAEFFGDDRAALGTAWTKKDKGNSPLLDLANSSEFSSFNNNIALDSESFGRFYVQQNEDNYGPGAVFRGSPDRPKKVVVLTDNASASAGDIFPHLFLGENLDGNLGSYTTCKIIGDIDGRLKGDSSAQNPMPVSEFNNFFYGSNGLPFSPFRYRADLGLGEPINGLTHVFYNQQSDRIAPSYAPSLRGTDGGAPLPNDWETTVWQDIGLIPVEKGHFSKHIKKKKPCKDNRATWRDCWLEQAILEAMK